MKHAVKPTFCRTDSNSRWFFFAARTFTDEEMVIELALVRSDDDRPKPVNDFAATLDSAFAFLGEPDGISALFGDVMGRFYLLPET